MIARTLSVILLALICPPKFTVDWQSVVESCDGVTIERNPFQLGHSLNLGERAIAKGWSCNYNFANHGWNRNDTVYSASILCYRDVPSPATSVMVKLSVTCDEPTSLKSQSAVLSDVATVTLTCQSRPVK